MYPGALKVSKAAVPHAHTNAEPGAPVLCRQASSQEASTSEPGQAAESGSASLEKTSPAAILEDMKRRMGWTAPAAPQQVSDEQQMVQAAEGDDKVADGAEVSLCASPASLGQAAAALNALHQLAVVRRCVQPLGVLGLLNGSEAQLWPLIVLLCGQQASDASVQHHCHSYR